MPWGAVAGAVVSAGIGAVAKSASGDAVSQGAATANGISQAAVDEARGLYSPYMDTGKNALSLYGDFTGMNGQGAADAAMSKFQASPGFQYQLKEGLRGVDAGAAAKGMLRSGATLKAEQTLGNNLASLDFDKYMGRLNTLAQFGMNGTNGFSNVMTGQANNQQQTVASEASKQASIYDSMGNQIGNAANTIGGELTTNYKKTGSIWGTPSSTGGGGGGGGSATNTLFDDSIGYGGYSPS
ncbi:MAG: hypothetical protein JWP57_4361 [Spirosoma sp.]|nr:hypothetical protein [Spirosoma sp.]